jgi:gamma-glutamyltranspeptidase / glutathione hydrolase
MKRLLIAALACVLCAPTAVPAAPPGAHAMVVTEQHLASQAGLDVLRAGGNAVDAAVAVGYALAVVDPCCGNIGGGGFMLVRMHDGRERFIDFREKAPLRATRDMYLDARGNAVADRSRKGWLAIGVPGTVMGLERARTEFGTMSRAQVMAPAIALARDGFVTVAGDDMRPDAPTRPGERIVQRNLAHTLESIERGGAPAFYDGPIAREIVAASNAHGGILSMRDFAAYTVDEPAPLHCSYHGLEIISAPPPSSGGVTLCEILGIVEPYPFSQWGWHSIDETHYLVEAERRAYADRNADLGDPHFVRNPVAQLLSPAYTARLRASIGPRDATPSSQIKPGVTVDVHENAETTHYSILDARGNAVAVTYTINDLFGSGVIAGNTGFYLNDEMDDFTSKPGTPNMFGLVQGERNDVQPGKRPLSSMAPTIVLRGGKLAMVTGSPGGSRIITIVLETLLNHFDFGMSAQRAVDAPRIHMQWLPDRVEFEPKAFTTATIDALQTRGYQFHEVKSWGSAQAIVVDPATGLLEGGTDRRHPAGSVAGL